jgi:putative ABC transport system substrate-binding protein
MKRVLALALLLALTLLAAPLAVEAQPVGGPPSRIGYLSSGLGSQLTGNSVTAQLLKQWREGLGEFGYLGRNLAIEYRVAEGRVNRLPELAAELVRLRVEEIVAIGPAALTAAQNATTTLPIVAIDYETDPVAAGFAASLAHPGGNVTGIFLDQADLSGKWLELLKEGVPAISRAVALWDPATPPYQVRAVEAASKTLRIRLQTITIRGIDDFERAFAAAAQGHAEAIVILSSPLVGRHPEELANLAARSRLPTISMFVELARAGGLFAYGPNQAELYRRLGGLAGRVLKGTRPSELPIERPVTFLLTVNLKTAKALGLTIPQSVLLRADEVIQ